MRKWFKYSLDYANSGVMYMPISETLEQHASEMGGYNANEAYNNKEAFFNKYFFDYHQGRLIHYDKFLRRQITRDQDILSIGSGRSANELFLIEDGFRITCSDLDIIDAYLSTKKLVPNLNYIKLNILQYPAFQKYDAVICLSMIYLFDKRNLQLFFRNTSESLKIGGLLILDVGGGPDNMLLNLLRRVLLRYEMVFLRLSMFIKTGKLCRLIIKHEGYQWSDKEIIQHAKRSGFKLIERQSCDFLTEFRRSIVFNKLIRPGSCIEKIFLIIGQGIPYIRMISFRKIAEYSWS